MFLIIRYHKVSNKCNKNGTCIKEEKQICLENHLSFNETIIIIVNRILQDYSELESKIIFQR
jgi:hypothetical protein